LGMRIFEVGDTKYLQLSWDEVQGLVEDLADRITRSGFSPDVLVGVLRGGMTVAHLLSDVLGFARIYPVGCSSYVDVAKRFDVEVYSPLALSDLSGRKVLLIDDVADEGLTLKAVVEKEISPKKPQEVKVATLHMKPWCKFKPDYFVQVTDAWIVYPWERWEVVRQVAGRFVEHFGREEGFEKLADLLGGDVKKVEKALSYTRGPQIAR